MSRDPYTGTSSDLGPLFSKPIARTTDPVSSHLAAKEIRDNGGHARQCDEVFESLREYVDLYGTPPTTRELSNGDEGVVRVYGKRLSDLEHAGRVRRAGMRSCRLGKRLATTWECVR
jgi:hypothetical protein